MQMFVYKIENLKNGKIYIGQTISKTGKRKANHFSALRNNRHINKHLQASWNKYGENCFSYSILDQVVFRHSLDVLERFWISRYKTTDNKFGYNKESGGNTNKKGCVAYNKGLPKDMQPMFGKAHSEKTKALMKKKAEDRVYTESELNLARINGAKMSKKVFCITNGKTYISRSEAARELNINRSNLSQVLIGKKKSVGGFRFKELD